MSWIWYDSVIAIVMDAYALFGLEPSASFHDILEHCRRHVDQWTVDAVRARLRCHMSAAQADVNVPSTYQNGLAYLKASAAMLMDPSARQCYDAWLDAIRSDIPEKKSLTRARLLWFNKTHRSIRFSEKMLAKLGHTDPAPSMAPKLPIREHDTKPKCRVCRCAFDFSEEYLVLHCHCTTRVGHKQCLEDFSMRVKDKCPVCRKTLLKRHQVSKYLFWNVKEKYKFIA
tara:strand:- start:2603 stop:3286 length:684 start_codon:yes stop_codon:yes gene_type:complete